jgi:hypothetical protein
MRYDGNQGAIALAERDADDQGWPRLASQAEIDQPYLTAPRARHRPRRGW